MTVIREPRDCGFVRRLVRIYREKRAPVPVKERIKHGLHQPGPTSVELRLVQRRMPRWAAWQIAWHQARNAQGLGTQE